MPKDYIGNLLDIFPINPEWTRREEWLCNGMAIHAFFEFIDPLTIELWSIYSKRNPKTFNHNKIEETVCGFKTKMDGTMLACAISKKKLNLISLA